MVTEYWEVAVPFGGMAICPFGEGGSRKVSLAPGITDETFDERSALPEKPLNEVAVIVVGLEAAGDDPVMVAKMELGLAESE